MIIFTTRVMVRLELRNLIAKHERQDSQEDNKQDNGVRTQ